MELKLRVKLGLGLVDVWSPEPVLGSRCKFLRSSVPTELESQETRTWLRLAQFYIKQRLINDLLF